MKRRLQRHRDWAEICADFDDLTAEEKITACDYLIGSLAANAAIPSCPEMPWATRELMMVRQWITSRRISVHSQVPENTSEPQIGLRATPTL